MDPEIVPTVPASFVLRWLGEQLVLIARDAAGAERQIATGAINTLPALATQTAAQCGVSLTDETGLVPTDAAQTGNPNVQLDTSDGDQLR